MGIDHEGLPIYMVKQCAMNAMWFYLCRSHSILVLVQI